MYTVSGEVVGRVADMWAHRSRERESELNHARWIAQDGKNGIVCRMVAKS